MKYLIGCAVLACLVASGAKAVPVYSYTNNRDGAVAPTVGATASFNGLTTSWIFGEVSLDPSWVGQPMWGNTLRFQNPTANPIDVGVILGVWAADGAGGGPGTQLDIGYTGTFSFVPGNAGIIVYTNWTVPAGDFWVGYAFETYGASTTAAELNSLTYNLGDAPTIGTSSRFALLGDQLGFIGSNPTIFGEAGNYLSQSIQMWVADTPEPSSTALMMGGVLVLIGLSRRYRLRSTRRG